MLRFHNDLLKIIVTDISTGRQIATVSSLVINPHDLSVAAFKCFVRSSGQEAYLTAQDIRDFKFNLITVQNESALSPLEELMRIQEFVDINYEIIGKKVQTESGVRLGVVNDYVIDDKSLLVSKLYVRPPLSKMIQSSDKIIGREQIIEISDRKIIVKDSTIKAARKLRGAGAGA